MYCEELPFRLYSYNTQDPKKWVKPTEEEPTAVINTSKLLVVYLEISCLWLTLAILFLLAL